MERHGHVQLGSEVRTRLLTMSAATIDRALRDIRRQAGTATRRRSAPSAAIRRSVPVRTFDGWDDPPPGFVEADLVAHSGPVTRGSFVYTLVLTDIATGRNVRRCWYANSGCSRKCWANYATSYPFLCSG